jgi:hypothetical protein
MRVSVVLAIATVASATVASATASATVASADPIGAVGVGSELAVSGGRPRQRINAIAIAYVTRRSGAYASLGRLALDGASGQLTVGVAYRAAAARPKLELVLHGDGGVAWPHRPVIGGGITTFLWPLRLPIAVTAGVRSYVIVDGIADTRLAWSFDLGLALAR